MRLAKDRRDEPRVGQRVPYVIVHGSPDLPLIKLVRQPDAVLRDRSLRLNVRYYITRQVLPPLDRMLSLAGISVYQWYAGMPKVACLPWTQSLRPTSTADSKQVTVLECVLMTCLHRDVSLLSVFLMSSPILY